jgi:very-short-patch-repair endonuclease
LTPNCIRYVGNFDFWVVTKNRTHNPDFKIKGQKKIIELFGDYWHKGEDLDELIKEYSEAGWKCIIFWENEVYNDTKRVLQKTLRFIKRSGKNEN